MKKPLLLLALTLSTLFSFAQFTLTGKVVDADSKEPLAGASVFAQNTTKGTTTDKDGAFRLSLDKGGYELIISFTGYDSRYISVQDNQELTIELKKADNSMSEVIIKSSNGFTSWLNFVAFFWDSTSTVNPLCFKVLS